MKTCYMCKGKSTSKGHVPPRCLFPENKDLPKGMNLRKSLITAPSYDLHNSGLRGLPWKLVVERATI